MGKWILESFVAYVNIPTDKLMSGAYVPGHNIYSYKTNWCMSCFLLILLLTPVFTGCRICHKISFQNCQTYHGGVEEDLKWRQFCWEKYSVAAFYPIPLDLSVFLGSHWAFDVTVDLVMSLAIVDWQFFAHCSLVLHIRCAEQNHTDHVSTVVLNSLTWWIRLCLDKTLKLCEARDWCFISCADFSFMTNRCCYLPNTYGYFANILFCMFVRTYQSFRLQSRT